MFDQEIVDCTNNFSIVRCTFESAFFALMSNIG
jgi:hypothetical protein